MIFSDVTFVSRVWTIWNRYRPILKVCVFVELFTRSACQKVLIVIGCFVTSQWYSMYAKFTILHVNVFVDV